MALQDRLFALAAKVVSVISLKNIAIWTFAALTAVLGYTIFQNRQAIVARIANRGSAQPEVPVTSVNFAVSDASKARIKQLVDSNDLINSISVLNVDIRNNRRIALHWYADDASIQRTLDDLYGSQYGGLPLFTSNDQNNEAIVGVINGEFSCNGYDEGGNDAVLPGLQSRVLAVCRSSLPPYYGQFSGFVTITLNRVASPDEEANLKAAGQAISTEIYFRDVLPGNRRLLGASQ